MGKHAPWMGKVLADMFKTAWRAGVVGQARCSDRRLDRRPTIGWCSCGPTARKGFCCHGIFPASIRGSPGPGPESTVPSTNDVGPDCFVIVCCIGPASWQNPIPAWVVADTRGEAGPFCLRCVYVWLGWCGWSPSVCRLGCLAILFFFFFPTWDFLVGRQTQSQTTRVFHACSMLNRPAWPRWLALASQNRIPHSQWFHSQAIFDRPWT